MDWRPSLTPDPSVAADSTVAYLVDSTVVPPTGSTAAQVAGSTAAQPADRTPVLESDSTAVLRVGRTVAQEVHSTAEEPADMVPPTVHVGRKTIDFADNTAAGAGHIHRQVDFAPGAGSIQQPDWYSV